MRPRKGFSAVITSCPLIKFSGTVSLLLKTFMEANASLFYMRRKSSWVVFLFSCVGETRGSVSIHWTPSCFAFKCRKELHISAMVISTSAVCSKEKNRNWLFKSFTKTSEHSRSAFATVCPRLYQVTIKFQVGK